VQFYFLQDSAQKKLQLSPTPLEQTYCIPLLRALPTHFTDRLLHQNTTHFLHFLLFYSFLFKTIHFVPFFTSMLLAACVLAWCISCTCNVEHDECENKERKWSEWWWCYLLFNLWVVDELRGMGCIADAWCWEELKFLLRTVS
jgi:hypothetical protein